ncbi:hypothetical protein GALMADRAFT_1061877 [Galerina marginata CBS 339.88]|uniref:DUF6535 domain-containing protein n=1 Tax=Galerina marginata (strain CBS 339.88) TaxID=685588 RepID=A0A067SLY2_GALM3|nr:hypothetical protein GALMADRAFT_1061877 [Galerina marginata CBS 339.88]
MAQTMPNDFPPWRCGDAWRFPVPNPKPNKHWEKCHDLVQKYDDDMFKAWKGEVDNLLIFAGLFSATVTSFTIDSYKWLQEASDDQALQILARMSLQLSQGLSNVSALLVPPSPFSVSGSAVRINIFWFLSLTLSMATVLIGILCMQWLREFKRDAARSHKDAIAIRQMRYEGLVKWKVPLMLSLLPLLLQLALVLFFAGVLDLLWSLHRLVAIVITIAVGMVLLVLLGTTVLPALQSHFTRDPYLQVGQCPYKSPQSWAFYRLSLHVVQVYRYALRQIARFLFALRKQPPADIEEDAQEPVSKVGLSHFGRMVAVHLDKNWTDYDIRWRSIRDATFLDPDTGEPSEPQDGDDIIHGLKWIDQTFSEDIDTVYFVFYCLLELGTPQAAQMVGELDPDVAYLPQLLIPTGSRPALYDGSPMPDIQTREHIYMVFLWLHRHIHPSLHVPYLECSIRLMNTTSQCVPHLALRQSEEDLQGVSLEIVVQLFNSLKRVVAHKSITKQHGSDIWAFLRDIYLSYQYPSPGPHHDLLSLTFDIFEQFHLWLRPSNVLPEEYRQRVETCAVGLTRVFALMDAQAIFALRQMDFFTKLERLVRDLDSYNMHWQDRSAILKGLNKRRWPDLMEKIFPRESTGTVLEVSSTHFPSDSFPESETSSFRNVKRHLQSTSEWGHR